MNHDVFILRWSEFTGLVLNKMIDGNLSDIVKKATPSQVFEIFV